MLNCGCCEGPAHSDECPLKFDSAPTRSEKDEPGVLDARFTTLSLFPLVHPVLSVQGESLAFVQHHDPPVSPRANEGAGASVEVVFERTANEIFDALMCHAPARTLEREFADLRQAVVQRILPFVRLGDPIKFVLVAFPFKSPCKVDVLGNRADRAEEWALGNLRNACLHIKQVYPSGCEVVVVLDGIVTADLAGVGEMARQQYATHVKELAHQLELETAGTGTFLRFDDLAHESDGREQIRASTLQRDEGQGLQQLAELVRTNRGVFDTYHAMLLQTQRFVDKLCQQNSASIDTQANSNTNAARLALRLMWRSWRVHDVLQHDYPRHVQLCLHAQRCGATSCVPVGLCARQQITQAIWAASVPWHGVLVQTTGGDVFLRPRGALNPSRSTIRSRGVDQSDTPWFVMLAPDPPTVGLELLVDEPVVVNDNTPASPRAAMKGHRSYAVYKMRVIDRINKHQFSIEHRYSEFERLHRDVVVRLLDGHDPTGRSAAVAVQEKVKFPPKTLFAFRGTSATVQDSRASALGQWIMAVLSEPVLRDHPDVVAFVKRSPL